MSADASSVPAREDSSLARLSRQARTRLLFPVMPQVLSARLASAEPALRTLIPYFVVGFLAILAFTRIVSLIESREAIENKASSDLQVAASLIRAEDTALDKTMKDAAGRAYTLLTAALPPMLREDGMKAFIADAQGRVVATTPGQESLIGREIDGVLDGSQPLVVFGERAGVMPVTIAGERALASAALLDGPLGVVALVHEESELYGDWRQSVSLSVTLFCVTSLVLLAILVAYFRQATRASESDRLLAEQHRRVETALSRGRCGLWDWDLARGRMYWSRSMFEILGMSSREGILPFAEVAALLHPDDGSFFEFARRIASGKVGSIERSFRMRRSDGQFIWLRARADVVRNAQNDIHIIGVAVDVSENQILARMTNEANLRLQHAVENISESFVLWDAEHRLVLCNSKYQEVFGLQPEDVEPGTHFDSVRSRARRPIEERQLTSPSFVKGERATETLLADGRWLQVSERMLDHDGGYVSIGTDVTQLKVHQERLSDSERRLMATISDLSVARRDAEAKAQQLAEMNRNYLIEKERAESANLAKTTFLANMSHELRTPLNAIIGFSEIMRENSFGPLGNPKYVEYASDIHESGHYLLKLINDILDMSKIEAGRMVLAREEMDLPAILREAIKIVEVPAATKKLRLALETPQTFWLSGDRRATKQILLNLLANAVKFTNPGGEIRVRTRIRHDRVTITIVDNGIGIPRTALRSLGRPFEQVENELTRTHKGTGLGLAIARSLIELQGGSMRIASQAGVGTAVMFSFPREDASVEKAEISEAA